MKKHSFIIAAAAMAAAVVLGTACTRKPAVETMETVTTEAPTEETTKPQPTATQPEETSAEAPSLLYGLHLYAHPDTVSRNAASAAYPSILFMSSSVKPNVFFTRSISFNSVVPDTVLLSVFKVTWTPAS